MPGITQNGRLHLSFHAQKSQKWTASPPILGGSGHEIKGVADHFGGFRAWIPERSDFFQIDLAVTRSEATFLRGPKDPLPFWQGSLRGSVGGLMEFRWISGSGGLGGSYWVRSQKMPSSRKCLHQNSVQNGPIDSFTALMGTIFVAISVFMSRAPKVDPDPKKRLRHKVARAEILCRMHRSTASQLSRGVFSWPFLCLCLWATFQQPSGNFWTTLDNWGVR